MSKEIEKLIVKLLLKEANFDELQQLELWITDQKNEKLFLEYIKINAYISKVIEKYDKDKAKQNILNRIRKEKNIFPIYKKSWFRYVAAVLIIVFFTLGFLTLRLGEKSSELISPDKHTVTLELFDGSLIELNPQYSGIVATNNGKNRILQRKNILDFKSSLLNNTNGNNTIRVPYGKKMTVVLPDSSVIDMNSGSTLTFPVKFENRDSRDVYLTGEAYFAVARNENLPFIVHIEDIDVKVLGTEFNISGYPEDSKITTVLIEGSVSANSKRIDSKLILKPGEKAVWDRTDQSLKRSDANIDLHTAWINGKILLRHNSFYEIVKKLERKYNINIESNDPKLNSQIFTASFDNENIEEVLEAFGKIYPINYYIKDGNIIITPK